MGVGVEAGRRGRVGGRCGSGRGGGRAWGGRGVEEFRRVALRRQCRREFLWQTCGEFRGRGVQEFCGGHVESFVAGGTRVMWRAFGEFLAGVWSLMAEGCKSFVIGGRVEFHGRGAQEFLCLCHNFLKSVLLTLLCV